MLNLLDSPLRRLLLCLVAACWVLPECRADSSPRCTRGGRVRYLALGDSYTIGEGVAEQERWPNRLEELLAAQGIDIRLIGNPSHTGWTSGDLIERELPLVDLLSPTFVTVLIGANDAFRAAPPETFERNFVLILETLKGKLGGSECILALTVPDYSTTPLGRSFGAGSGESFAEPIRRVNEIMKREAARLGVPVVDLFELSGSLSSEKGMLIDDGLHPSGAQYARWVEIIAPIARRSIRPEVESRAERRSDPPSGR